MRADDRPAGAQAGAEEETQGTGAGQATASPQPVPGDSLGDPAQVLFERPQASPHAAAPPRREATPAEDPVSLPKEPELPAPTARTTERVVVRVVQDGAQVDVEVDRHDRDVRVVVNGPPDVVSEIKETRASLERDLEQGGYHLDSFEARDSDGSGKREDPSDPGDDQPVGRNDPATGPRADATPPTSHRPRLGRLVDRFA